MVKAPAWGDTRTLEEIVAAYRRKRKLSAEHDHLGVSFVRDSLNGLVATKARYEKQDRGKTRRAAQVEKLRKIASALNSNPGDSDALELVRLAYLELGPEPDLNGQPSELATLARAAADRLESTARFKFARRWRPYLYSSAIPEIGWLDAGIPPTPKTMSDGRIGGLAIEFVRTCLEEIGERDASPKTISFAMKKARMRRKLPSGKFTWYFHHPWGRSFNEEPGHGPGTLKKMNPTQRV